MHPILSNNRRLAVYLAVWIVVGMMLAGLLTFPQGVSWSNALLFAVPPSLLYGFINLSAWYLCRVFPFERVRTFRVIGSFVAIAVFSSGVWSLLIKLWLLALAEGTLVSAASLAHFADVATIRFLFAIGVVLYLSVVSVHYLLLAVDSSRDAEQRLLELRVLAKEAELKALRTQIDPHFLFNSLNSVSALISSDPAAARSMVLRLSDFFRKSVKAGLQELISLEEELSLVRDFVEIERVRFGDRLSVSVEADDAAKLCLIPPLLLQPLVENAFNHGIVHLVDGGSVNLIARRAGSLLRVELTNDCDPDRPASKGTGTGLENVRRRLVTLYGEDGRLESEDQKEKFVVHLTFPAA